eukprot:CAMPEP_0174229902 /NCGR_PEP_ID=MMETSP0417-20130205/783_1 /TAXON_ID=242541 /ORGANISM="Mayorella sp, Strain BSH-02190019" /LENGTH=490 /DNA_ID=CAMNT_0015307509 /DNA_START=116 /DNA_END=1584 /DNA_ORIENTATION=-
MSSVRLFMCTLLVVVAAAVAHAQVLSTCDPDITQSKRDCGYVGITQSQCENKGCCWYPEYPNPGNQAFCFYPNAGTVALTLSPGSSPFNRTEVDRMMSYFLNNIDIDGRGGVIAAPDTNTGPGGNYEYAWMRDAALSMRTLMFTNSNAALIDAKMRSYVSWVLSVQNEADPHEQDVRTEPKFLLPDGEVFPGAWCRPQTDGPGLRGGTLALYAILLIDAGQIDYVRQYLYTGSQSYNGGAVVFDLNWVADNWPNNGCDLWEELQSNDFFWNRYNMRYGLAQGIELALKMNDTDTANRWKSAKQSIESTLSAHYNGQFVYESTNRQQDSAVLLAFNHGDLDDGTFSSVSPEVAGTISTLSSLFTDMFSINGPNSPAGLNGVLMGRYQGDTYNGGNPWVLCSAALAQLYYRGATATLVANELPSDEAMVHFRKLLNIDEKVELSVRDFALALTNQGDAVLLKIRYYTARYAFHQPEQLERDSGDLTSAMDLT